MWMKMLDNQSGIVSASYCAPMPPRVFQPLVEVFLLVEQPRQRLSHWSQALAPLDGPDAPPVASVDAYYDPTCNQAIFGLRYDERALGAARLGFIVEVALLAEIGMIQPAELSEGDRRRFVGERLSNCTVHVGDHRKVVAALVELVRRIRTQKGLTSPSATETVSPVLPRPRPVSVPGRPRTDPGDPVLLAKGTRKLGSDTDDGELPKGTRELAQGSVRQSKVHAVPPAPEPTADADPDLKRVVSEPLAAPDQRLLASALPQRRDQGLRPSPNVISRSGVHRAETVMMPTVQAQQMLEAASRAEIEVTTEQYMPKTVDPAQPGVIYGRYLRGGRWIPTRIGALSLKGASLMAGALPRVDDRVEVSLSFEKHRALVRGAVAKVSTMQEAAATGATTFSVNFELDDASRRELTALLTAARAAKVTIKPPPARSTRRYPVEWPVTFGTARGSVRAEALDVSTEGMFVRPLNDLALDANLTFTAVLDDAMPPVSGRARAVRRVGEAEAHGAGLSPGYGLMILEMADPERERWCAFLARIEKRASKRVLIGAAPARLAELQSGLVAAGYAVTGGSDRDIIAQLASAEARPVDAALIDAAWLVGGSAPSWVDSLFASRNVPYVAMHGDAKRARVAIDKLLAVV
jgi:hypothetical protein